MAFAPPARGQATLTIRSNIYNNTNSTRIIGGYQSDKQQDDYDYDDDDDDENVRYLSSFVAKFSNTQHYATDTDTKNNNVPIPPPYRQKSCDKDTTNLVLEEWKNNHRQLVCDTITTTGGSSMHQQIMVVDVHEYVLDRWQNKPTVFRYKNAEAMSLSGPSLAFFNTAGCRPNNETISATSASASASASDSSTGIPTPKTVMTPDALEKNSLLGRGDADGVGGVVSVIDVTATMIRVEQIDIWNSYERFHSYLNVAMVMIMFDVRDPQLVLISNINNNILPPEGDKEMWRIFSKIEPIFVTKTTANGTGTASTTTSTVSDSFTIHMVPYRFGKIRIIYCVFLLFSITATIATDIIF